METEKRRPNLCESCKTDPKNSNGDCWYELSVTKLADNAESLRLETKNPNAPRERLSQLSQGANKRKCNYVRVVLANLGTKIDKRYISGQITIRPPFGKTDIH